MPLYSGTAEMAIRSGAEIVPIAIEEYGKDYYVNIGKNIHLADYTVDQKVQATEKFAFMQHLISCWENAFLFRESNGRESEKL